MFAALAENSRISAEALSAELRRAGAAEGVTGAPSASAIRRMRHEFDELRPERRRVFGAFRWPETFENGDLPWEAAPAVMDAARRAHSDIDRTVGWAQWVWRIHSASPEMPAEVAGVLAGWLATEGANDGGEAVRRTVETFVLVSGWRPVGDGSGEEEYVVAVDQKHVGPNRVLERERIAEAANYLSRYGLVAIEPSGGTPRPDLTLRLRRRGQTSTPPESPASDEVKE